MRQAIEQVRLFIELHGDARFETLDVAAESFGRPVHNRAGWRKGDGVGREWFIPPEVWKKEICVGLHATMVARTLAERGMLRRQGGDTLQCNVKIGGAPKRVYVVTANIFDGGGDEA